MTPHLPDHAHPPESPPTSAASIPSGNAPSPERIAEIRSVLDFHRGFNGNPDGWLEACRYLMAAYDAAIARAERAEQKLNDTPRSVPANWPYPKEDF